jgi:hypothetical protein
VRGGDGAGGGHVHGVGVRGVGGGGVGVRGGQGVTLARTGFDAWVWPCSAASRWPAASASSPRSGAGG